MSDDPLSSLPFEDKIKELLGEMATDFLEDLAVSLQGTGFVEAATVNQAGPLVVRFGAALELSVHDGKRNMDIIKLSLPVVGQTSLPSSRVEVPIRVNLSVKSLLPSSK